MLEFSERDECFGSPRALSRALQTALLFGLCVTGLYAPDAHSSPSYCTPSGCSVFPPPGWDNYNGVPGYLASYWDWTGWYDNNPFTHWGGVTLGDIGGGGGHPAVCNAIRDDGPQNCSADDVSPATGLSTQVEALGAHPASGLSLLNAAANDWWTPASAAATIRYAIMNYVDTVSGIRAGQPAESIIRNAGYDLITAAASACPDFGMNIVGGWTCHHAVATLAWELGWPNWHNELAQRLGVSAVSVGGGVVSVEFQVSGTNSMEQMNAEIARRNACSTMADALQRNECPLL